MDGGREFGSIEFSESVSYIDSPIDHHTVGKDETAMQAFAAMRDNNVDVVFIVDDGGIPIDALSISDFLEPLAMEPPSAERLNVAEILDEIEREMFSLAKNFSAEASSALIEEVDETVAAAAESKASTAEVEAEFAEGKAGRDGKAGKAGKRGKSNKAGKSGKSGKSGRSGKDAGGETAAAAGGVTNSTTAKAGSAAATIGTGRTAAASHASVTTSDGENKVRRKTFGEAGWYLPANHVRGFAPSARQEDLELGVANYFASFYQRAVDFGPPRKAPRRATVLDSLTKTFEKVLSSRVSTLPLFNASQTEVLGCITPSLLLAITLSWNDYDCVRVRGEGKGVSANTS